ncbi:MAG: helix-turn-helix transcriptional regulator [Clostridiales bacterium]|nr:helix-turn-helix transcriptional regulator [Clostridiales bacterium]
MDVKQFNPVVLWANHQSLSTHLSATDPFPERVTRWHEIDIVTYGGGCDVVSGVSYPVRTGDVFYRVAGLRNQHFRPYYCYFFVFDPIYRPEHEPLYALDALDAGEAGLGDGWDPIPPFSFATGPSLGKLIDIEPIYTLSNQLLTRMQSPQPDPLRVKLLFYKMLHELNAQLTHSPRSTTVDSEYPQYHCQIEDLCYFIRTNPETDFSVAALADRARLSPNFLSRVFRAVVGRTPMQYVRDVKLNHVKTLLLDTELSVSRIAELAGFDDPCYMFTMFKKQVGETPQMYRRRIIGDVEPR